MPNDFGVEGIAGQSQALIGQQVFRLAAMFADFRTYAQHRKIAGASAEIADQNQLVVVPRGPIKKGPAERLKLKSDLFQAGPTQGDFQPRLRVVVVFRCFRTYKAHRAAAHHAADGHAELLLGFQSQVARDKGDQIFQRGPAPEDLGVLETTAAQERLQRLDQASFVLGRQVTFDALRTGPGFGGLAPCADYLLQVQERSKSVGEARALVKASETNGSVRQKRGQGAVGGAEIQTEGHGLQAASSW